MLGMSTDVLHKCDASTHRAAGQDSPLPYRRTAVQAFVNDETKQGDGHESERRPIVPCCTSAATSTTSRTSTSEGGLTTTTTRATAVRANGLPAECGTKALEEQSVTHNTALTDRALTSEGQYDSQDTSSNDEDEKSAEEMEKYLHTNGNEGAGVRDVSRLSDAPAALSAMSFAEGGTSARNGSPSALPTTTMTSTAQPTTPSEANDETSPLPSCVTCELGNKTSRDARWASFVKPPRQQGAVVQLYSLTQLDALIDSGARYMSHGDGSSLRTTGRTEGNQSDRHEVLCLQPGESVLLLLHHGERGLSDVTNRFTSELSQVRIFALNLDALPPQDYSMAEQHALSDMNGDASTPSAKRKKTEGSAQHVGGNDELNCEDKRYKSSNRSQGETNHTPTVDDEDDEEEEMLLITPHKAAMISTTTATTTTTATSALHEGLMSSGTPTVTTTSHTLDKLAVLDCSTLAKQLCTAAESVICYLNRRLRLQLPLAGTAHASSDESDESGKEREVLERNKSCSPSPALSPAPPTPSRLSSASLSRPTPLRPTTLILWRAGGAARADYPHSPPDMHGLAALSQPVLPFDEDDVSSEDDEPHAADDEAKTTVVVSGRAFRQSLRCRGRPLAAKEIRTVEQLHSLSLWTPVYTVPHLCRTAKEKVAAHPRRVALQAAGQPTYTLLYLGASWCPPCMRFVATMPQLICEKMPENILCTLKADMDFAKPIYKALKVEIIPTFVILDNAVLCAEETTTTTVSSAELLTQRLLRAEVARVQNSQLTVVATFLEKNCKPLSFEEDF